MKKIILTFGLLSLAACTSSKGLESSTAYQPPEDHYQARRGLASVEGRAPASQYDVAQTDYLDQNWSEDARQKFYWTPQGSHLMPYNWAKAMENADNQQAFMTSQNLARFGFIPQAKSAKNPDGLPIGFTKDGTVSNPQFGMNCAACHTSEVYFKNRAIRIEGGPGAVDFQKFVYEMDRSIFKTAEDEAKFRRFAERVYGSLPEADTQKAKLRSDLAELVKERAAWQKRNHSSVEYGMGRNDAFGVIFNQVLDRDLGIPENAREPNAPVSYPVVWDAHQHDIVQWIGIARNNLEEKGPLSRNLGQVLGVFGHSNVGQRTKILKGYCSTARRQNLEVLEGQMKTLTSPKWPEQILGTLDASKVASGKRIYESKCMGCHSGVNDRDPNRVIHAKMIPVKKIGTDAKVATNAAYRTAKTGSLEGLKVLVAKGRKMKAEEPAANVLRHVVAGSMIGTISPLTCGRDPDDHTGAAQTFVKGWFGIAKASVEKLLTKQVEEVDAGPELFMVYKARPLNGAWASAPYLHNGSVKNMYEMLLPAKQRSQKFATGCQEVDVKNVGFECEPGKIGTSVYDASVNGNSNAGHEIATDLSEDDRMAVLEYIKSI